MANRKMQNLDFDRYYDELEPGRRERDIGWSIAAKKPGEPGRSLKTTSAYSLVVIRCADMIA